MGDLHIGREQWEKAFALAMADLLELPPSVISQANELLDQETGQMGDLVWDLENQKSLVVDQLDAGMAQKGREIQGLDEEAVKKQQARLEQR